MTQHIEESLWKEFEEELEKAEKIKIDFKSKSSPNQTEGMDKFWEIFLSENLPTGELNKTLEKNFALYIVQNDLNLETIKQKYIAQGWNPQPLLGWIKKVMAGEITDYNIGELVNWTKQFKPELMDLFKGFEGKEGQEFRIFTISGQVEYLYKQRPFFYNRSGMFVIWNNEMKMYEIVDEVDILLQISKIGVDTISTKSKNEILNALKQYGRKMVPKEPPKTWVQFKDKIFDFKTGEEFEASPEYFITNPLPYQPSESEETPTIDRLFVEWVGEDYKETLFEIVAYSCSSHQFLQRLIALVGAGSNGKGTFVKLLTKFIGKDNACSSEIRELSENQFETSTIYKKLLCVMGEVSSDDLKNTNQIKKLAGEDSIRFCFKGKTPFTEESGTTLISATNSLPITPDRTLGFYRRWLIVDFPNQFTQIKGDLIESIPEQEFSNLARKVLGILKRLYKKQGFTNEGDFDERMKRYEARSNPVMRFVEEFCEQSEAEHLRLRDFADRFNQHAKKNHLRIQTVRQISRVLREEGLDTGKRNVSQLDGNMISSVVILNTRWKK